MPDEVNAPRGAGQVEAAGGVVFRDGKVCVVHRARSDGWSLPKGKLDAGESFDEVDELRWCAPEEAARLLAYAHDRALVASL